MFSLELGNVAAEVKGRVLGVDILLLPFATDRTYKINWSGGIDFIVPAGNSCLNKDCFNHLQLN